MGARATRSPQAAGLDCQRCGACCCNTDENRAEGYSYYVEIRPGDALLGREDLVKRLVFRDPKGIPHLKLNEHGRCEALAGKLGQRVRCTIYEVRPTGCRKVTAGDENCLRARRERGIDEVCP